jgi:hypothetical protein
MHASKEEARKVIPILNRLITALVDDREIELRGDYEAIRAFLVAAEKKLPLEASFTRQQQKKINKKLAVCEDDTSDTK